MPISIHLLTNSTHPKQCLGCVLFSKHVYFQLSIDKAVKAQALTHAHFHVFMDKQHTPYCKHACFHLSIDKAVKAHTTNRRPFPRIYGQTAHTPKYAYFYLLYL
jgi:hypothetical protein